MQFRNGHEYTPTCSGTGPIPYADHRGRSVRCGECLVIAVHANDGDTSAPYVHATDKASCGHSYIMTAGHTRRHAMSGRIIADVIAIARCKKG